MDAQRLGIFAALCAEICLGNSLRLARQRHRLLTTAHARECIRAILECGNQGRVFMCGACDLDCTARLIKGGFQIRALQGDRSNSGCNASAQCRGPVQLLRAFIQHARCSPGVIEMIELLFAANAFEFDHCHTRCIRAIRLDSQITFATEPVLDSGRLRTSAIKRDACAQRQCVSQ